MSDIGYIVAAARREKERAELRKSVSGCLSGCGRLLWVSLVVWWRPFAVMLAFGVLHDRFPVVPAFGFWESWLLVIAVSVFVHRADLSALTGAKKKEKDAA